MKPALAFVLSALLFGGLAYASTARGRFSAPSGWDSNGSTISTTQTVSTDAGLIVSGAVVKEQFGSGGSLAASTIVMPDIANDGICFGVSTREDGGVVCLAQMRGSYGNTVSTLFIGGTVLAGSSLLFDGGTALLKLVNINSQSTLISNGPLVIDGGLVFAGGGGTLMNALASTVHDDAGTAYEAIEHGRAAFTAGSKAVTFHRAFSFPPDCWCVDIGGSALACGPQESTNSVSGVTFLGTLTDDFKWFCIGDR